MALSIFLRCFAVLVSLSLGRAYTYVPQGTWDKPAPARVPTTTTTTPAAPSCKGVFGCLFRSPMRVEAPSLEAPSVHAHLSVKTASGLASNMGPVSSAAPSKLESSCKGVFRCLFRRPAGIESGSSEAASIASGNTALPAITMASMRQASTSRPASASSAAPSEPGASRKGVLGRLFRRHVGVDEELPSLKLTGAEPASSAAPVEPEASCRGLGCWIRRRAGVKASSSAASGVMSGIKRSPSITVPEASHTARASSAAPVQPGASCKGLLCRVLARRGGVGSAKQPSVEGLSVEVPSVEAARPASPLRLAYEDFRRLFGPLPLIVAVDRTVETCLSTAKAPPPPLPPTLDVPPAPPRGYWRRWRVDSAPVKHKAASGGVAAGPIRAPLSDDDMAKALCFNHGLCFGVEDDVAGYKGREDWLLYSPMFWLMTALRFLLAFAVIFVLLHDESNAWVRSAVRAAWRRVKEAITSASARLKQFKALVKQQWAQRPTAADLMRRLHAALPQRLAGLRLPPLPPNLNFNLNLNLNLNFNLDFNWPRVCEWLVQCYHRVVQCPRMLCTCVSLWWARVMTWPAEARRRVPALLASLRGLPAYLHHLFTSLVHAYTLVRSRGVSKLVKVLRTPDGRRRIKASIIKTLWPPTKPDFWDAPRMCPALQHRRLHELKISEDKVGPFAHFFDARNVGLLFKLLKRTDPFRLCPATSLLPIHDEAGDMLGYGFVSLTPHSSHVALWLLDARHSILSEGLSLMRLALAYTASPLPLPVCPREQLVGEHVPAQYQELRRAQRIINTLRERAHTTFDHQVLPGVEVLCRPALPSKNNNNPRASHKVITATGGLYALDNAFPLVQEALMVGSRGPSAVGPAVVGVTDVAAPSAPTTRTSRPQ